LDRLRRVAAGEEDADLVVRGGTVVVVQTGDLLRRDVFIAGRFIAAVTRPGALTARRSLDATGRYVLPGYVDGRIQVERTLLAPGELARLVVPHGTVTVLTDTSSMVALAGPRGRGLTTSTRTPARLVERRDTSLPRQLNPLAFGPFSPVDLATVDLAAVDLAAVDAAAVDAAAETLPSAGRSVVDLAAAGHLDADVHTAVCGGLSAVTAIQRATVVPARLY
nr:hypothetical protein [Micromonospora sp. DSM 115978]